MVTNQDRALRYELMTPDQRREKLRTTLHHLVAYAESKRDIRRWHYDNRERRLPDGRDLRP